MGLERKMVSYKDVCLGINGHNVLSDDDFFKEHPTENPIDLEGENKENKTNFMGDPLVPVINLSEEERAQIHIPWKRSILVKLLGKRLSLKYFHASLMKLWQPMAHMEYDRGFFFWVVDDCPEKSTMFLNKPNGSDATKGGGLNGTHDHLDDTLGQPITETGKPSIVAGSRFNVLQADETSKNLGRKTKCDWSEEWAARMSEINNGISIHYGVLGVTNLGVVLEGSKFPNLESEDKVEVCNQRPPDEDACVRPVTDNPRNVIVSQSRDDCILVEATQPEGLDLDM
ncbi:hypothetical protein SESBI_01273 [Sesbania bispinosa]|nr:hypothetical protein SESBI_01273 [Sesbania bispinosa]